MAVPQMSPGKPWKLATLTYSPLLMAASKATTKVLFSLLDSLLTFLLTLLLPLLQPHSSPLQSGMVEFVVVGEQHGRSSHKENSLTPNACQTKSCKFDCYGVLDVGLEPSNVIKL